MEVANLMREGKLPFRALGRDLFCDVECSCADPEWTESPVGHLFKRKIKLTGYADDYFFEKVNADAHEITCECGWRLRYQWFRDGVQIEFLAPQL